MAILIFSFSSIPCNQYPSMEKGGFDYSDITNTVAHLIEYALLSFLTLRAFDRNNKLSRRKKLVLTLFLTFLFAASDEWHQSFVPERECRWSDWLVDLLGVLTGTGLFMRLKNWSVRNS